METKYWEDGTIQAEIPYKNGKKDGTEKRYDMDGNIVEEIIWEDGNMVEATRFQ